MWPQKPGTAPGGARGSAAPAIQGGTWAPLSTMGKLSARSPRKHAPHLSGSGHHWRSGPGIVPLESIVPGSRPGTRGKADGALSSTARSGQFSIGLCVSQNTTLFEAASQEIQDFSMGELFASTGKVGSMSGHFLTQEESSFYQPNSTPFQSYQSPIQTRLQREIAHRSAKMIASTELGLSDRDEKTECPASLVRLRFQEHRFLVDELYQQQDLRKEVDQKYALLKEELASCHKSLKRLEAHKTLDQYVEEINKLKAYGESLEQDNHLTLQRLEMESDRHADLQGVCKNLLNAADLEWRDDHTGNLSQLEKFADLYLDRCEQLKEEKMGSEAKLAQLHELSLENSEVETLLEEALADFRVLGADHAALNLQCRSLVESFQSATEIVPFDQSQLWCEDLDANLSVLQNLEAKLIELVGKQALLTEKHVEKKALYVKLQAQYGQLKVEKEALEAQDLEKSGLLAELQKQKEKIASLEERCESARADYNKTTERLEGTERQHKDLKTSCADFIRSAEVEDENTPLPKQFEMATAKVLNLRKSIGELQGVHNAMKEESALIRQREHEQSAEHHARYNAVEAVADAWETKYKDLAKAHAQLESQWMELREWRMPEPEQPGDRAEHPKLWGIQVKQLEELHDEIICDLEEYSKDHEFVIEDGECVHICCHQPCRFDGDHRSVMQKCRTEISDPTILKQMVPNMYIVVDRYLKPRCAARGPKVSYSKLLNPNGLPITAFVSHTWLEPFRDFVTTLKIALDPDEVAWVCSFALPQGQKEGVQAMISTDLNKVPFSLALKHAQKLVVVLDANLDLLRRAWCIYEIEKARRWGIPTLLWAHQPGILIALRTTIDNIDFRQATATYPEDRDAIAQAIEAEGGYDTLNDHLRRCIRDRAAICEMAVSEMKGELDLNNEELMELRKNAADGAASSNQAALDVLLAQREELERQLKLAEKEGQSGSAADFKRLLRKLQMDEAALVQEKNLLLQMSKDMQELRSKDNTDEVVDGVSTKLLGVLEPMLEQFMTANRRGLQGVRKQLSSNSSVQQSHIRGESSSGDGGAPGSNSQGDVPQVLPLERAETEPPW